MHGDQHQNNVHEQYFPTKDEELVEWARQKFGGVTSFTTIRNMQNVSSTGADGEHDYILFIWVIVMLMPLLLLLCLAVVLKYVLYG